VKALQLSGPSEFEIVELPVPQPGPNHVRIRVRACGICGSDVHGMDGSTGRRIPPIVMGHEASGEIDAVGESVEGWQVGDRVTLDSTLYCGKCGYCRAGQVNLCEYRQVLGVSCPEFKRQGAFAEFAMVPARVLHRLPEGLSFVHAAMAEPTSVALHAINRAAVRPEETVAVVGSGMIGLLAVQALKARGVGHVIAVDIDPAKTAMAKQLGSDESSDSDEVLHVDVAIEAVGLSATVDFAVKCVGKGGRVVLIGNLAPTVAFPLQVVVTRELTVFGTYASAGEYPEALELIARGAVKVEPMISATCSLEEAPSYFERLYRKDPGLMKVVVCP
jgi:L-iditol 2-dehydrogenase